MFTAITIIIETELTRVVAVVFNIEDSIISDGLFISENTFVFLRNLNF